MSNLAKYEDFSIEDAQDAAEELDKLDQSDEIRKLPKGDSTFRMLPGKAGLWKAMIVVQEHWMDSENGDRITFVCPRTHAKPSRRCPACEREARLKGSANPRDNRRAYEFRAKTQGYANVVDRKNEEAGPKIWKFGKTIYEQLISLRANPDAGGNFTDITENGFDLVITRKGEKKEDTEYVVRSARNFTALSANAEESTRWLDGMHDLRKKCRVLDDAELEGLIRNGNPKSDGDGGQRRGGGGGGERRGRQAASAADDLVDADAEG